ncbi:unnamed protein product, partial [Prorocentrum cordatum]
AVVHAEAPAAGPSDCGGSTGGAPEAASHPLDPNDLKNDFCEVCQTGGRLLLCDRCPRAFHVRCIERFVELEGLEQCSEWRALGYCMRYAKCRKRAVRLQRMRLEEVLAVDRVLKTRVKKWALRMTIHRSFLSRRHGPLRLMVRRVGGATGKPEVTSRLFSHGAILDVAYSWGAHPATVAAVHDISVPWVRCMRQVMAAAYMYYQNKALGAIVVAARARRPSFCISRLAFDETGERITVPVKQGDTTSDECATWHVLVARLTIYIGWHSDEHGTTVVKHTVVLPNLVVASPSAPHIHAVLFRHKVLTPIFAALRLIQDLSDRALSIVETDAAMANDRLWAHMVASSRQSGVLDCRFVCRLHGMQLIRVVLLAVVAGQLLSRLCSIGLLFVKTSYFTKMVKGVPAILASDRLVIAHAPTPGSMEYAREVIHFAAVHYKNFQRCLMQPKMERRRRRQARDEDEEDAGSEVDDADIDVAAFVADPSRLGTIRHAGLRKHIGGLLELLAVANGPWWHDRIYHVCGGDSCCVSRAATVKRLCAALRATVFAAPVRPPAANKWGKLAQALDVLVLGFAVHKVWPQAFARLQLESGTTVDADMDQGLAHDLMFAAVTGSRYAKGRAFLEQPATHGLIVSAALVLEPMSAMTSWLMRRARDVDTMCKRPLMDLTCGPYSVVGAAMQYLSSMLSGEPRRLIMLWRPSQCTDFQQWLATRASEVRLLRRLVLLVSASIYRRFVLMLKSFPWQLVSLADARVSEDDKMDVVERWDKAQPCCVPPGFAKKLKERGVSGADLLTCPGWQLTLQWFAVAVRLQVADIEWRHKRNRVRTNTSTGQTGWGNFSAEYINAEAVASAEGAARELAEGVPLPPQPAAEEQRARVPNAKSAKQIFRQDKIDRDRAAGRLFHRASEQCHAEVSREWDNLSAADRGRFEMHRHSPLFQLPGFSQSHPKYIGCEGPQSQLRALALSGVASPAPAPPGPGLGPRDPFPLNVAAVQHFKRVKAPPSTPGRRPPTSASFKALASEFKSSVDPFALRQHVLDFPGDVEYPKCCGPMCATTTAPDTFAVYTRIVAYLTEIASCFGTAKRLADSDALLMFEVRPEGDGDGIGIFVWFCLMTGRYGPHPAAQTFALTTLLNPPMPDDGLAGMKFILHRDQRVAPADAASLRPPLRRQHVGQLNHFSEEEFAEMIVNSMPGQQVRTMKADLEAQVSEGEGVGGTLELLLATAAVVEAAVEAAAAAEAAMPRSWRYRQAKPLAGPVAAAPAAAADDALLREVAAALGLPSGAGQGLGALDGLGVELALPRDFVLEMGIVMRDELRVEVRAGGHVHCLDTGRHLGHLMSGLGSGAGADERTNIKARCATHRRCECWLWGVIDTPEVRADLLRWLAESSTEKEHAESAYNLKTRHGMRPRKPAGLA